MSIDRIILWLMGIFMLLGALDRIFGSKFGLGEKFEEGIQAIGALGLYISDEKIEHFQPMNVNFSIISPLEKRIRKKAEKNLAIANRSLEIIDGMLAKGI